MFDKQSILESFILDEDVSEGDSIPCAAMWNRALDS